MLTVLVPGEPEVKERCPGQSKDPALSLHVAHHFSCCVCSVQDWLLDMSQPQEAACILPRGMWRGTAPSTEVSQSWGHL